MGELSIGFNASNSAKCMMQWKQLAVDRNCAFTYTCSLNTPASNVFLRSKCELIMYASKHLSFSHGFLCCFSRISRRHHRRNASASFICVCLCVEIFIVNIINIWLNGSSFTCSLHDLLDKNLCKHPAQALATPHRTTSQRLHLHCTACAIITHSLLIQSNIYFFMRTDE